MGKCVYSAACVLPGFKIMSDPKVDCQPTLRQTSFQKQYAAVPDDMLPLLGVDADMAAKAKLLDDNARKQVNRINEHVGPEVER